MIKGAVRIGTIATEYRNGAQKVWLAASTINILVKAARWALELVDDKNPPLLEEDRARMARRPTRERSREYQTPAARRQRAERRALLRRQKVKPDGNDEEGHPGSSG